MRPPDLAPPPYGAEVDLRTEKSFRLPADFFTWRYLAMMTAAESGALFRLVAKSLTEVPAGSLLNDEALLIDIAGFRDQMDLWPSVRAKILFGWQACSDGRLYNLDMASALKGMARQRGALANGKGTQFKQGNQAAKGDERGLEPPLGERRGERRTDAVGNAVSTPSGKVLAFQRPAAAQPPLEPPLTERRGERRTDAVSGDGLACARAVGSNKEVTYLGSNNPTTRLGGVGDRNFSVDGTSAIDPDGSTVPTGHALERTFVENANPGLSPGTVEAGASPSVDDGVGEVSEPPKSTAKKRAPKGSNPNATPTARLNAAAKALGKPVRRKSIFPEPHFPEKLAYLWNEICWEPFVKLDTGAGAGRAGRLSAKTVSNIRQRYLTAQRIIHGTTRTITTLEDWANFFRYISTSKFLMGEIEPGKDRNKPWRIEFTWLFSSEEKFEKTRNGKYHTSANARAALWNGPIPKFDEALLKGYAVEGEPEDGEVAGEEEIATVGQEGAGFDPAGPGSVDFGGEEVPE